MVDDQRRLWVTVRGPEEEWDSTCSISKDASLRRPSSRTIVAQPLVRGESMYAVVRDQRDVPSVIRLRVRDH
jgi:hypothetical protein